MSGEKYDAFVFDLYGTLVDIHTNEDKPSLWKKFSEMYASLGAHYTPAKLRKSYWDRVEQAVEDVQAAGAKSYGEDFLGEPDLTAVFQGLLREKGVSCSRDRASLLANFFRMLSREKLKVYDGVKETLGRLRQAGKKVYLLSNAQSDFTRPEIELLGLVDCFDGILISSEEGCKKPSPVFYKRLLERYELVAERCLMTGNDVYADIAGARAVGMDTLYIHTDALPLLAGKPGATYAVLDGDWYKVTEILLEAAGV